MKNARTLFVVLTVAALVAGCAGAPPQEPAPAAKASEPKVKVSDVPDKPFNPCDYVGAPAVMVAGFLGPLAGIIGAGANAACNMK